MGSPDASSFERTADMSKDATRATAGFFALVISRVVSLLCTLAADGVSLRDTHPGNFGLFGDGDVRVIDWADAEFHNKPGLPSLIWDLARPGFRKFRRVTTAKVALHGGVAVHPSWVPILGHLCDALGRWQSVHYSDPVNGLGQLPLLCDLPESVLPESAARSSAGGVNSASASTIATRRATSGDRRPHIISDGPASVGVRGTMSNAVAESFFVDLRARIAKTSLYTDFPNRPYWEHAQGRSGNAEIPRDEYLKIYAVSGFVWYYIQQKPFCHRFSEQPPPKAYSDRREFTTWLFRKMKACIASNGGLALADDAYWTALMVILRQAWQTSGGRDPQCNWKGWWFLDKEFDRLESVLRDEFSRGFGVPPES